MAIRPASARLLHIIQQDVSIPQEDSFPVSSNCSSTKKQKANFVALSPQADYTD
jgi:hypothetical protein